jgi:Protein of unknown function (DUF2815)
MERSKDFKTPLCRLSFANSLFKPRAQQEGGTEKYGCTLIFDKSVDRRPLEEALRGVIVAQWGDKGLERAKAGLIKSPFLDGAGKEARNKKTGELHPGYGPDVFFIRVQSIRAPLVRWRSENIPATEDEVYSGCYGKAVLNAFAWTNAQNGDGVSFGIQMFQKLQEGERLGGGGGLDASSWMETVPDMGEAPDATRSGAGAGGLFGA